MSNPIATEQKPTKWKMKLYPGTVNGVNTSFTLANTPVAGSVRLYCNSVRMNPGAGNDYTISGNAITMLTAPLTGEVLKADYRK